MRRPVNREDFGDDDEDFEPVRYQRGPINYEDFSPTSTYPSFYIPPERFRFGHVLARFRRRPKTAGTGRHRKPQEKS